MLDDLVVEHCDVFGLLLEGLFGAHVFLAETSSSLMYELMMW